MNNSTILKVTNGVAVLNQEALGDLMRLLIVLHPDTMGVMESSFDVFWSLEKTKNGIFTVMDALHIVAKDLEEERYNDFFGSDED